MSSLAQYEIMLKGRKDELTYTDTGQGLSIMNNVKFLPIHQVMMVLCNEYGADAQLNSSMIADINWLACDETFRRDATPEDDVPGQLVAVLNKTAIPQLCRHYPYTDLTGPSPVLHKGPYYEAYKKYIGLGSDSESEWESETE